MQKLLRFQKDNALQEEQQHFDISMLEPSDAELYQSELEMENKSQTFNFNKKENRKNYYTINPDNENIKRKPEYLEAVIVWARTLTNYW